MLLGANCGEGRHSESCEVGSDGQRTNGEVERLRL